MDDTSIVIATDLYADTCQIVRDVFARFHVVLNEDKCETVTHGSNGTLPHDIFPLMENGTYSLGCPIACNAADRQTLLLAKVDKMIGMPVSAFHHISPLAGFTLLKFCVNSRCVYLARVSEHHEAVQILKTFADYVDKALPSIMRKDLVDVDRDINLHAFVAASEDVQVIDLRHCLSIRSLPLNLGGLGLPRLSGMDGQLHCMQSRAATKAHLTFNNQQSLINISNSNWPTLSFGSADREFINHDPLDNIPDHGVMNPKKLIRLLKKQIWKNLVDELNGASQQGKAAMLISTKYETSGAWLHSGIESNVYYGKFRFYNEEFLDALSLRCLFTPFITGPGTGLNEICVCPDHVSYSQEPLHCLECRNNQGPYQTRHNSIRDALSDALKSGLDCRCVSELPVGFPPDNVHGHCSYSSARSNSVY